MYNEIIGSVVVAAIALISSTAICSSQFAEKHIRLQLPRGRNTVVAKGFVGGEATDYYVVHAREGQRIIALAVSPRRRTQVYVSWAIGDVDFVDAPERSDLTRWEGRAPRTGDYLISVNVYPGAEHYTLKITVADN